MKKITVFLKLLLIACAVFAASLYAQDVNGPGVRMLDSLADKYEGVRFDHAQHTLFASSCGTCHHQHGEEAQTCKDCHALGSGDFKRSVKMSFLSCQTCHGTYDPSVPDMPGLKVAYHRQCLECHGTMGSVGLSPQGCTEQCHAEKGAR